MKTENAIPDLPMQMISQNVLQEKYCQGKEKTIDDVQRRVARALASVETENKDMWEMKFLTAMREGFIPGGRIMASAGVDTGATLINCFVQPVTDTMQSPDRMKPGIMNALGFSAETMRRGGGVGYDFSEIRPRGALVRGTNSRASGPVSYMRIFNEMCSTVESAGSRRGAQMAILRCDHPDILEFIACKDRPGEMTNFNISVAITEDFMDAVRDDKSWNLIHNAEPAPQYAGALNKMHGDSGAVSWRYESISAKELWDRIIRSTYDHAEPGVFFIDRANRENNLSYCETLSSTNPCGEQPLPPYGCCDLGSINLTEIVVNPFSEKACFNWRKLRAITKTAVRMLDNVLDITYWPLQEQRDEAMQKRRIGLGVLGLGDALLMINFKYDTPEGRNMAQRAIQEIRDEAYRTSIQLAEEKDYFPALNITEHLTRPFMRRLPESIQEGIWNHGIRNSHLLSIAPTGTIALAFANNASSGIEPPYAWFYKRKKRMSDGTTREFEVEDHANRKMRTLRDAGYIRGVDVTKEWKTALEISPKDHLLMVAALQPYVDSAISKTVNIPEAYPFEEFKGLYTLAWEKGLKGLTTYRPNKITGSVLSENAQKAPEPTQDPDAGVRPQKVPDHLSDADKTKLDAVAEPLPENAQKAPKPTQDPDARVRPQKVPEPALATLRWQRRPMLGDGNMAWCQVVEHPLGKFAVFIGETEDRTERLVPFEVWVNGEEQPRGLGALAKSLSMDMRSEDGRWLRRKLDYLGQIATNDAFDLPTPPDGKIMRMPSLVAGFARLVQYRCHRLGVFEKDKPTPVLDACFRSKDLDPGTDGTLSWTVDIENPNTGDEIVLGLREMTLPDKSRRPYELWLAGKYPRILDGLCRNLSLDMRVIDPAWIGAKLRQILDYQEPFGDFRAREPGSSRTRLYPSTIAYIARLVIHRYTMLGILDEQGMPIDAMGVMHIEEGSRQEPAAPEKLRSVGAAEVVPGHLCRECGSYTLIRKDGCDFCTTCGYTGGCG